MQLSAINQQDLFEVMMEAGEILLSGQITNALFEVGGKYRRNMWNFDFAQSTDYHDDKNLFVV